MLHAFKQVRLLPSKIYSKILSNKNYKKTKRFLIKRPFRSFFITLLLLLLIIIIGNIITNRKKIDLEKKSIIKDVSVYRIGEIPTIRLQAKIEKKGVIKIVSLTSGVVSSIYVTEGDTVIKGQTLVRLASNYQGGNAPNLNSQLAAAQYNNVNATFETQKEIIQKQREIAEKTHTNTEELRKISEESINETRGLLSLNEQILESLNNQLKKLEEAKASEESITAVKGQKAQLEAAVNQLKNNLRNLEYATNKDNPPTHLADLQRDLTFRQLDLQDKALQLNKNISRIQYNLALLNESLMYPSSPFPAIVERVHVQIGQVVNPGTPLVTIACPTISANAVVVAPRNIALLISRLEPSLLYVGKKKIAVNPSYISSVATDGQMYSIVYNLPENILGQITEENYLPIDIPLNVANLQGTTTFIPIDAVYQSQKESYVTVVQNGRAETKKVILGSVLGKYVEIISGLKRDDQIILNRNIISGDKVQIVSQ